MSSEKISVLVVEDSPVIRNLLKHTLESDPEIEIIEMLESGEETLKFLENHQPDVITIDLHMPKMNGFQLTAEIMKRKPTPIIIVSAVVDPHDINLSFKTLEAGALSLLSKPKGLGDPQYTKYSNEIIQTIKLISKVKWIKEGNKWITTTSSAKAPPIKESTKTVIKPIQKIKIVGIGCSTGGPQALNYIFKNLPKNYPLPILVVQHISSGFIEGLVNWLKTSTNFPVCFAKDKDTPLPGNAYIAPDGYHLGVNQKNQILLSNAPLENGVKPSASFLFRSLAMYYGTSAAGVILTGMGHDGAKELLQMNKEGAYTIVQDESSSIVFGMPKEAINIGAAKIILPLEKIPQELIRIANNT